MMMMMMYELSTHPTHTQHFLRQLATGFLHQAGDDVDLKNSVTVL